METLEDQKIKEAQSITANDVAWICLSKWYYFVIALVITCGYAVYKIAKTPKVYTATAAMLVKDNGSSSPDVSAAFSEMSMLNTNVNMNNEMVSLKSPMLMKEVAQRLGLDINYVVKDGLRHKLLYGSNLPATLQFLDLAPNDKACIALHYNGDGSLEIGPIAATQDELQEKKNVPELQVVINDVQGDTLQTSVGRLLVIANEKLSDKAYSTPVDIRAERIGYNAGAGNALGTLKTEVLDNYSSVIHISVNDINTERAAEILQTLINVYNENWIKDRNQISVSTSNFINERLTVIESELGDVDNQIFGAKAQSQTPDAAAAAAAYFDRTLQAGDQIAELQSKREQARAVKNQLSSGTRAYDVLPGSIGLGDLGLENQIAEYNTLVTDRKRLIANSSESNPIVENYNNELAALQQSLLSAVDNYIGMINAQISSLSSRRSMAASQLSNSPIQEKQLLSKERQQKVKEELYLYLLQKREENELSQAFTAYNTKVVMTPSISGPVAPNEKRIFTMAIAAGILIPGVLIFFLEVLNSKVRGRRDLECLTIPFAGEIPQYGKAVKKKLFSDSKPQGKSEIVVNKGSNNVINEAFRVIRTNLEFMVPADDNDSRVLMVTSANPGSGKTFVSLNLATVLALKGKRVALIDLDLRKSTLSSCLQAAGQGMSNYLAGSADYKDIAMCNVQQQEGLDLYPAGPIPPNPSELLYSPRLKQMLDEMRNEYDLVVVDCPPVEVVADTKIVNSLADLTLFVIRAGVLERAMLPNIQRFYNTGRYRNMAVILNGTIDPSKSRLNKGNRFGYGYGYGYGYTHKKPVN